MPTLPVRKVDADGAAFQTTNVRLDCSTMAEKETAPGMTGNLPPPSVTIAEPLLSSYLYSTSDRKDITDEEEKLKRDNWIMGIDEAGRGPVLGEFPQMI
jgi:hypothetical protein